MIPNDKIIDSNPIKTEDAVRDKEFKDFCESHNTDDIITETFLSDDEVQVEITRKTKIGFINVIRNNKGIISVWEIHYDLVE